MDDKEKLEKEQLLSDALTGNDIFELRSIDTIPDSSKGCNHFFCIGAMHVAYASNHCGGILSPDAIERSNIPCAVRGCQLPYSMHFTLDIAFLTLKRNADNREANQVLVGIKPVLESLGLDGIAFVETQERFRILPPKEEPR